MDHVGESLRQHRRGEPTAVSRSARFLDEHVEDRQLARARLVADSRRKRGGVGRTGRPGRRCDPERSRERSRAEAVQVVDRAEDARAELEQAGQPEVVGRDRPRRDAQDQPAPVVQLDAQGPARRGAAVGVRDVVEARQTPCVARVTTSSSSARVAPGESRHREPARLSNTRSRGKVRGTKMFARSAPRALAEVVSGGAAERLVAMRCGSSASAPRVSRTQSQYSS